MRTVQLTTLVKKILLIFLKGESKGKILILPFFMYFSSQMTIDLLNFFYSFYYSRMCLFQLIALRKKSQVKRSKEKNLTTRKIRTHL